MLEIQSIFMLSLGRLYGFIKKVTFLVGSMSHFYFIYF